MVLHEPAANAHKYGALSVPSGHLSINDEAWTRGTMTSRSPSPQGRTTSLRGRRVLIVEDEPLVAIDIEEQLTAAGAVIVGPAASVERALQPVAEASFDVALLDGNLGGRAMGEIAAALTERSIPFAFATGYGSEGLPQSFQKVRVLAKPFSEEQVIGTIAALLADRRDLLRVVSG